VGFDLVDQAFDLPSLVVGGGQFDGWPVVRIKERGDEPDNLTLAVSDPVRNVILDHSHRGGLHRVHGFSGSDGLDDRGSVMSLQLRSKDH
jgi:hypothetical protein